MILPIDFISQTLKQAGKIVRHGFHNIREIEVKENQSNIMTQVDWESEYFIIGQIEKHFPNDSIIAEESGFQSKSNDTVWIIDPLDGSSNFAAGLPWFGVMIAQLKNWHPECAGIYLSIQDELYLAEKGKGAFCNHQPIHVTTENNLTNVLVSYGIDFTDEQGKTEQEVKLINRLVRHTRNLRTTNSVFDYCAVATGKFGAYLNQTSKIWDNAAPFLLVGEAGGKYTDIQGQQLDFTSTPQNYSRNFTSIAAAENLHGELLKLVE